MPSALNAVMLFLYAILDVCVYPVAVNCNEIGTAHVPDMHSFGLVLISRHARGENLHETFTAMVPCSRTNNACFLSK